MYASNSHSNTHLILALGIVIEPTVWVFITSKYPGIHDIGPPTFGPGSLQPYCCVAGGVTGLLRTAWVKDIRRRRRMRSYLGETSGTSLKQEPQQFNRRSSLLILGPIPVSLFLFMFSIEGRCCGSGFSVASHGQTMV